MPIETRVTTAAQREREHAVRAELAATTTLAEICLPSGGTIDVERHPGGYRLSGRLDLFGAERFDTLPLIGATDDDQAVRLADRMVRERWADECRADTPAEAAALGG